MFYLLDTPTSADACAAADWRAGFGEQTERPDPQYSPAQAQPSGWLALELDAGTADTDALGDTELVDAIVAFDHLVSWAAARQARLLAEFARRRPGDDPTAAGCDQPGATSRYAPDEIGLALGQSRLAAKSRLTQSVQLTAVLPDTLHAWENGHLDTPKVRAICDATLVLRPDLAAAVAHRVLPRAPGQSLAQLRAALTRAVIAVDPGGRGRAAPRSTQGPPRRRRRRDRRHGLPLGAARRPRRHQRLPMAQPARPQPRRRRPPTHGHPPRRPPRRAPHRTAHHRPHRTDHHHRADHRAGHDRADHRRADHRRRRHPRRCDRRGERGQRQHRHRERRYRQGRPGTQSGDIGESGAETSGGTGIATLPPRRAGARPTPATPGKPLIHIVMPHSTLIGTDDHPADLIGYGPISAELAREIAADAVWKRLVADPASGALLDHGRTTYRPPQALADFVRARDVECRFPTCRRRTLDTELDHTRAWADKGTTSRDNLWGGCPHHHHLKHDAGWTVALRPDASMTWTTPTGHTYTSEPHDYRPEPLLSPRASPSVDPVPARPTPGTRFLDLLDGTPTVPIDVGDEPPF